MTKAIRAFRGIYFAFYLLTHQFLFSSFRGCAYCLIISTSRYLGLSMTITNIVLSYLCKSIAFFNIRKINHYYLSYKAKVADNYASGFFRARLYHSATSDFDQL